jgi:hypothetical protein
MSFKSAVTSKPWRVTALTTGATDKYLYAEKQGKCMKDFSLNYLLLTYTTQLFI